MKFNIAVVLLPLLLVLPPGGLLHGQRAVELDTLLDSREITWAQACRFVLPAAGALEENSPAPAAYATAQEKGWLPRGAAEDGPVNLGGLSFLIVKSFSIKGSVLFVLFPGPRYAYRQLDYLGLIPGQRDPALKVSGERLVQILGRVLDYRGEGEPDAVSAPMPEPSAAPPAVPEPAVEPVPAPAPVAVVEPPKPLPELPPEEQIQEEREQMVLEIREELTVRDVADTTVRVVEEGVAISLDNIQFLPDDTALTETERIKVTRIADILNRYPGRKILVGGHTAQAGSVAGRLEISTRRAQAVADFLVFLGSRRPDEIRVRGYGGERPLGDNGTPEGQALNRRVEITILDE
jgi:outer membrane protein OmpA-like peptidoglycan-associated protein